MLETHAIKKGGGEDDIKGEGLRIVVVALGICLKM